MRSTTHTYKNTLQLIADILSFEYSTGDLKQKLSTEHINWEQFVTVASDHLVLTTCYCRLKQRQLLDKCPKDLKTYLEEITAINRNRNQTIIKESKIIADIFKAKKINYVFLKGTALLIGNYYQDLGERMVGDIDILVDENQTQMAFNLLLKHGYKASKETFGSKYFEHKHLPRLRSKTYIAAVEIHRKALLKPYKKILVPNQILLEKRAINDTYIPSNNHLVAHTILNFQINDLGQYYTSISLRSYYDTIILFRKSSPDKNTLRSSYIKSYFSIAKSFFIDFKEVESNRFTSRLFRTKFNNKFIKKTIDFILKKIFFIKILINRLSFFFKNKNYRNDVFKDYKRLLSLTMSKFIKS